MKTLNFKTKSLSFLFFSFLFFSFLFFSPKLSAQFTDPLRIKLNSVFQNVNKSQVPTQFLEEYAHPLLPMQAFNGTLVDSIRTDIHLWRQLYATTYTAFMGTTSHPMPTLSTINTTINSVANAIPIPLLHWNYNIISPTAVSNNLLSVSNDQIYDVAGRSQSPYISKTLFAAAPSVSYSDNANISFVLRSDLFIKNTGTINAIYLDLADGVGYRQVTLGTAITTSYANTGIKRMKVKIVPASGSVMESWFDFRVNKAVCTNCLYTIGRAESLIDNNFLPNANHSGGTVTVIRSVNNNTGRIRKPLIIAEGYDISSIAPTLSGGNWDIADLIGIINAPSTNTNNPFNFNASLDNTASYDLVFIDYNNGSDDIKRNARLLQAVIRRVNTEKALGGSTEQNVVMGLSMGGLVARFGLAQMVRSGENPQTRLLITHDSPHRGANVPLGAQFLGQFAANQVLQGVQAASTAGQIVGLNIDLGEILMPLRELRGMLNAPATQQMLVTRATSSSATQTNTFLAPGGEYRTMVDNLTAPYQVIATSNGSQCGNQLFPQGSNLTQVDAGYFFGLTKWIWSRGMRTSLTINAAQNQQANQVLNFRVYTQYKIFGINININVFSLTGNNPTTALALDGAPGGTYPRDWLPDIPTLNTKSNFILFGFDASSSITTEFCFVPTASALDVTNFNAASLSERYINGVNVTNPSRFGKFIAQETFINADNATRFNQQHITFTPRNSRWLFDQMEPNRPQSNQECATECTSNISALAISGNTNFCTGTQTYSVNNTTQSPVTWTVSPTNIVTLAPNGNSVNLTKIGNGTVTLSARIGNCNNAIVNRTITVGEIYPNFSITELQKPCPNGSQTGIYVANVNSGSNITYSWSCSSCSFVAPYGANNDHVEVGIDYGVTYPVQFTLTAVANGTCGSSNPYSQTITTSGGSTCDNGGAMMMAISPNPANSQLQLKITDPSLVAQRAAVSYQITISDAYGNIKYANQSPNQNHDISLARLSPGVYSIRVIKGRNILNKTFTIVR